MRTNQHGHRTQHANATAQRTVTEFFKSGENLGFQPRLRDITGTCQFNIEGAGSWRVAVKDGVVKVSEAGASSEPARSIVTATAEDMARLLRGEGHLNVYSAVLQEILTVSGDIPFTTMLLLGLTLDQASVREHARTHESKGIQQ